MLGEARDLGQKSRVDDGRAAGFLGQGFGLGAHDAFAFPGVEDDLALVADDVEIGGRRRNLKGAGAHDALAVGDAARSDVVELERHDGVVEKG